jgi:sulfate transport system ATP-binding protein
VRPHDVRISVTESEDSIEAMVRRVVHLGFEVRVELELPDGSPARAQLTRGQAEQLELGRGDIVYVRAPAQAPAHGDAVDAGDEAAGEDLAVSEAQPG